MKRRDSSDNTERNDVLLERVKTISFNQHKEAKGWTHHVERSSREVARNNVSQQQKTKLGNKRGLGSGKSTGKRQRQEVRKLPPRKGCAKP